MLSIAFLNENWSDILFFVLLIIVYTIYVTLKNGVDKSIGNIYNKKPIKTVILETFKTNKDKVEPSGFCASNAGYLEKNCSKLNRRMCNSVECCVYAKFDGEKSARCVAGDDMGPTFKTNEDSDMPLELEYFYYKNKKLMSTK